MSSPHIEGKDLSKRTGRNVLLQRTIPLRRRGCAGVRPVIIGTAGHVDHGKTALIRALTGRDTDRLPEEKRRGLTIDLGFTWFDLRDGTRCGIVDVPGHERFIRNMAAGAAGMDLVLMTVAADEGIMPQTREHLDILELFGVERAVVVLTKCDLVSPDWLDLVETETRRGFAGSILEHAPFVRVSSRTGEGIQELKTVMEDTIRDRVRPRDRQGLPRLPIDRAFTVPGFGTVITGTLLSGTIRKGDTLELYPAGGPFRVRGIQVHGENREECGAGERTALNLPGLRKDAARRGCVLAPPGSMVPADRADVRLRVLETSNRIIRDGERLRLCIGTAEGLCRAVLLDHTDIGPGESALARLTLAEPLALRRGERFVVRYCSPPETIGGGVVLDPNPRRRRRADTVRDLLRREAGGLSDTVELKIRDAWDAMTTLPTLARDTACSREELRPCLAELEAEGRIETFPLARDTACWHTDAAFAVRRNILRALDDFYGRHPYRYGLPQAEIHQNFLRRLPPRLFDAVLNRMVQAGYFQLHDGLILPAGREIPCDETYQAVEKTLTAAFEGAEYRFLRLDEVEGLDRFSPETVTDILFLLKEEGRVVQAGETYWTMRHYMDTAEEMVQAYFQTAETLTIAQVRERFGTSRKRAKAMVEYLDARHVTRKTGAESERVPASE